MLSTPLLTIGGRIVLMSPFDPAEHLGQAAPWGATTLFMVPSLYQTLLAHADFEGTDLRRVRVAITGGAACPAAVVPGFGARPISVQGYGMLPRASVGKLDTAALRRRLQAIPA